MNDNRIKVTSLLTSDKDDVLFLNLIDVKDVSISAWCGQFSKSS